MRSRLSEVRLNLQATSVVLGQIEAELDTRLRVLKERQQQLETYDTVAGMCPEQRDTIERMVADQFKREGIRGARRDVTLLVLGVLVAVITGFAINSATGKLGW